MDGSYDEVISDNPFFIELKSEYSNLFQHCISESWILCVPRIGSLHTRVFTVEDFCSHILVPSDELPETHYSTLTEKQVTVNNRVLTLELTKGLPLQSHILFEETFYTEDFMKYKVWCIESPLEPTTIDGYSVLSKEYLLSINDCIDLLWTQAAGRQVLDQIETCVFNFIKKNLNLPIGIRLLKDAVSELYTNCLQITLQNRRLREKSKACKQVLENIKLAVECYMQHLIFNDLFKPICTSCAYEDAHLNKKIRNMSDIQLRDLDIKKDLFHAVPKAKQILSRIDSYHTVLEKIYCLKQALNTINRVDSSNNIVFLTADDLLPVFVFLVIKSGLPNWYSQLTYIKEFRFSCTNKADSDESSFLITTLEAVIEHINSGALTGLPDPESYYYDSNFTEESLSNTKQRRNSTTESVSTSDTNSTEETLEYIFDLIKANQYEQVKSIFEKNQKQINSVEENENIYNQVTPDDSSNDEEVAVELYHKLCHPLCSCKKCFRKISKNLLKISPTINSRDSHGLTALHIACIHGKATIVEALVEIGANIESTDLNECTPLHYAASRGHQNALLLLMHSGANINKVNIDKNTPLHLAVNNGHISCVKALIYFAEHSKLKVTINCKNEGGNTPLHMASKWGYEGIAKLLIENGAEPSLQNHYNKTAFDYAHNLRILKVLKSSTPNLYEYIHLTSSDVKQISAKIASTSTKYQYIKHNDNNASKSIENLKIVDRILKTISYGDIKLACFYMNIDYDVYDGKSEKSSKLCHPLCGCNNCTKITKSCITEFDVNTCDTNGLTALHFAAKFGYEDLCKIMILNKANINCVNKMAQTPLHLASLSNKIMTMRILLENGANVNAINLSGNTPLHDACHMGNIGATKVLISYNADVSMLNGAGKLALDIAKDKVHLTIIDLIEKYIQKPQTSLSS